MEFPRIPRYSYAGPPELERAIDDALRRVVDPEVAMNIVDVGLVYGVAIEAGIVDVTVTMTSPACPVADVILQGIENELDAILPADLRIRVRLEWEPPWSSDRMSASAKEFMGW